MLRTGQRLLWSMNTGRMENTNVTLVYHEDSRRLGLTIGDKENDITDPLREKGVYTQDYTLKGKKEG